MKNGFKKKEQRHDLSRPIEWLVSKFDLLKIDLEEYQLFVKEQGLTKKFNSWKADRNQ